MAQLIDKDALIVEIKRLRGAQPLDAFQPKEQNKIDWLTGKLFTINSLDFFLDTMEVKEVDLEKEIDIAMPSKYCWSGDGEAVYSKEQMRNFAKHFFELGMAVSNKAQKGE